MKLSEAFAKGPQQQPKFNTTPEQIMLKMFKRYEKDILQGVNEHIQNMYGRTIDFNNNPEYLEMALDEVFSTVAGEIGYIMDEADKDMMIGEWFED